MSRFVERGQKSIGARIKEVFKPEIIEAGSLSDFARLIAKNPNPPSSFGEAVLRHRGADVHTDGPLIRVVFEPSGPFSQGIRAIYFHDGGKPRKIIYTEKNPHSMDPMRMLEILNAQKAVREQLGRTLDTDREALRETMRQPGLTGLGAFLGELAASIPPTQLSPDEQQSLSFVIPRSPASQDYHASHKAYFESFDRNDVMNNLQAFATAEVRGSELLDELRRQFGTNNPNVLLEQNFGPLPLIHKVIEENDKPPAWEQPTPQKTRSIRRER